MECTQRLGSEFSQCENVCPGQIGFLGILGSKYPVKRGPNKVGRDPQTCSIVLNLNTVSRQHAVINVLSGSEYMLMDLDSANKTRLNNKVLQAYVPAPLSNGDTVQFGEIFGVFCLLEEDNELPATQVVGIPDTPVQSRTIKLRQAMIPESPDISDRDDSFVVPSQPPPHRSFKSPSDKCLKASSKTISIQPIGSGKIDNVFWNSSKKSTSFSLDNSDASLNESSPNGDIHEAETQAPNLNKSSDCIYTAATQLPDHSQSIYSLQTQLPVPDNLPAIRKINDQHEMEIDLFAANKENDISIYNAETQFIPGKDLKPNIGDGNIHDANTQLPGQDNVGNNDNDGTIFTAETQYPAGKDIPMESDNIFNANTQIPYVKEIFDANTQMPDVKEKGNSNIFDANTQLPDRRLDVPELKTEASENDIQDKLNTSNDTILFDELETQEFMEDFQSQPILPPDLNLPGLNAPELNPDENMEDDIPLSQAETVTDNDEEKVIESSQSSESDIIRPMKRSICIQSDSSTESDIIRPMKRSIRIQSDSSTDCDDIDILPTQKIPPKTTNEDDLTDCEDSLSDTLTKEREKQDMIMPTIEFEDLATQVIPETAETHPAKKVKDVSEKISLKETSFPDLPTQVVPEENCDEPNDIEDLPTQILEEDIAVKNSTIAVLSTSVDKDSPFKIPLQTPIKTKKKDIPKSSEKITPPALPKIVSNVDDDDDKYYAATQDILEDLCSQREASPEIVNQVPITEQDKDIEVLPSSDDILKDGKRLIRLENETSPNKKFVSDRSSESSDGEEKVDQFLKKLSNKQIVDIVGVEVQEPKKVPSDPSDVEVTPKKLRPFNIFHTDLPNSQEIKTSVPLSSFTPRQDDSVLLMCSESETDNDSQENTPIVFHKKKRATKDVKKDLITKFEIAALPTRPLSTRTRKPPTKVQESAEVSRNILKPKFLLEQEDEVDPELITENITKLRNNTDKIGKHSKDTVKVEIKKEKIEVKKEKNEVKKLKNKAADDSVPQTATTRRKIERSKKPDVVNIIDLTKAEEPKVEKSSCKSASKSPDLTIPTRRQRNRRQNEKTEEINQVVQQSIEKTKIEEKVERPKSRGPRKMDSGKKANSQEKITNYTISTSKSIADGSLSSTKDVSLSARSTRKRNTDRDRKSDEKKSASPDPKPKRGRPRKNQQNDSEKSKKDTEKRVSKDKEVKENDNKKEKPKEISQSEEAEVRRSKRQRTVKESNSQNQTTHEQSTVYNISSESNAESPKVSTLKRSATTDINRPFKKTRSIISSATSSATSSEVVSVCSSGTNSNSSSRRSTPSRGVRPYHVMFTAFPCEDLKSKLEKLGAVLVGEPAECSVVVTLQLRRTVKLLCAVGLGRPVVGAAWLQACQDNNALVDPWQYLLKDEANEQRFTFDLERTLTGPRNYLKGCTVSATPSVLPSAAEMKRIVECSGGTWSEGGGRGGRGGSGTRWVAVSCRADNALWGGLRARGASVVSTEFILTGVLRQQLIIEETTLT